MAPMAAADGPGPAAAVDTTHLMAGLSGLPVKRAARGDIESQQGLADTETYLMNRLKELGFTPRFQDLSWNLQKQIEKSQGLPGADPTGGAPETTPELSHRTWHNIVVDLPGTDLASEVLIVGAHFDAVPDAPGADDNGTGIAALLELARVLKDHPTRRTIRLAFFNLEELGVKGSADYVRAYRRTLDAGAEKLVGMISLEMLGYFTDEPGSQKSPIPKIEGVFDPPTVGDFIAIATTKAHQPFSQQLSKLMHEGAPDLKVLTADFMPIAPPDMLRSDHAPFLLAGLPAVIVTDTSNFRNPNYHKPSDTLATIDQARFTAVVRGLAHAVYHMAEPAPAGETPKADPKAPDSAKDHDAQKEPRP